MTLAIPSLSNIFSSLTKGLPPIPTGSAPVTPAVPSTGIAWHDVAPTVPNLSSAAPAPNATSVATKQPVYIAPGQSQPANSTSTITKLPTYSPPVPALPAANSTSVATQQPVYSPPPTAPAVPSVSTPPPATATYTPPPPVTMNSGVVADPATGAIVSSNGAAATGGAPANPVGANTGNAGGVTDYSTSAGGAPALPSVGAGSDPTAADSLFNNPLDQAAYDAYIKSLSPSADETAAQQRLNALNASAARAYTDASGQPIALPFITGQQAQLQREQATLAGPLESQLALLQAQRQASSTGSKAALDRQDAMLAAKRDLATKTVNTSMYGTSYAFNPNTNKYEQLGTGASGVAPDDQSLLNEAVANGVIDPKILASRNPEVLKTILGSLKIGADPNNTAAQNKYFSSPTTQQMLVNIGVAKSTLQQMSDLAPALGNGSPQALNQFINNLKSQFSDQGVTDVQTLAALAGDEVGKILGSGQGSDFTIKLGASLANPNLSTAALQEQLKTVSARLEQKNVEMMKQGGRNPDGSRIEKTSSGTGDSSSGSMYDF